VPVAVTTKATLARAVSVPGGHVIVWLAIVHAVPSSVARSALSPALNVALTATEVASKSDAFKSVVLIVVC